MPTSFAGSEQEAPVSSQSAFSSTVLKQAGVSMLTRVAPQGVAHLPSLPTPLKVKELIVSLEDPESGFFVTTALNLLLVHSNWVSPAALNWILPALLPTTSLPTGSKVLPEYSAAEAPPGAISRTAITASTRPAERSIFTISSLSVILLHTMVCRLFMGQMRLSIETDGITEGRRTSGYSTPKANFNAWNCRR